MANALEVEGGYTTGGLELSIQGPLDKGAAFDKVVSDSRPAGLKVGARLRQAPRRRLRPLRPRDGAAPAPPRAD